MRRRTLGLIAGVILVATPIHLAQPASAETSLEVEAGFDGHYTPGRPVPVRVTIEADRLVRGTLLIESPMGQSFGRGEFGDGTTTATAQLPVEVPGGSVKQFVVNVPTASTRAELEFTVRLDAGGESASEEIALETQDDRDLVGLLPGVTPPVMPGPLNVAGELGTASLVALDENLLASAPASIAGLTTLVAATDELTELSAPVRQGILQWVDGGGRLVIDAAAGTRIEGLPEDWQDTAGAGRVLAGFGEIRFGDGAAAAGRWTEIVEPSPAILNEDFRSVPQANLPFFEDISNSVARDAGFQVASLGGLLAILGAYFVIVGPVAFFVLHRRQRPELAWVVVPSLAVVFALVAFAAGSNLRRDTTAGHGTIVTLGPGGSAATTYVGLLSRNGRDGQVTLPDGWSASPVDNTYMGGMANSVTVTSGGDRPLAQIPLDAGQFGVLTASGPVEMTGRLEVRGLAAADGTVQGEVRNTTEKTLHDVGVFVENRGTNLGTLDPGETRTWTIKLDVPDADGNGRGRRDPFNAPENEVWPDALDPGRVAMAESSVNSSLWWEAMRLSGWRLHMPGVVTVAGWTRDIANPLDVRSDEAPRGRSVVVSRGTVGVAAGSTSLPAGAVRRELMLSDDVRARADGEPPAARMTLRYAVPPGTDPGKLEITIPDTALRVEGWTPAGWQTLSDSEAFVVVQKGDGVRRVVPDAGGKLGLLGEIGGAIPLPPEVVQGGTTYLRVEVRADVGMIDPSLFSLRGAA